MTGLLFSALVSAQADPEFIYFILVDRFNNGDHKNDPDLCGAFVYGVPRCAGSLAAVAVVAGAAPPSAHSPS